MANVLIAYGAAEGQTAKISEYIARIVRDLGHHAEVVNDKEPGDVTSLEDYEAVIVGTSIYMGRGRSMVFNAFLFVLFVLMATAAFPLLVVYLRGVDEGQLKPTFTGHELRGQFGRTCARGLRCCT